MDKKTLQDRFTSAIWVPVAVVIITAALIISVGELLLLLSTLQEHVSIGGIQINEPWSVLVALIIATVILGASSWLARGGRGSNS